MILDKYQEQPHLLDPYLGVCVEPVISLHKQMFTSISEPLVKQLFVLTQQDTHPIIKQQAFRYLYLVSKVRGPKVMVRWFPHEVSDFNPVLTLLQQQDPHDYEVIFTDPPNPKMAVLMSSSQMWETRYMLLLWLSFLLMVPFDLSRMDGSNKGCGHGTLERVFEVAKLYVGVRDKCRDAAAILLAR